MSDENFSERVVGFYLSLCIVWKRGSSESLSRPSDVCRLSLGNDDSSSGSFSLRRELE